MPTATRPGHRAPLAAADDTTIRLTSLSSCAGCAAKVSQPDLAQLLRALPQTTDANLLVGSATGDDAGVYRVGPNLALVQTVDFFTPIVDDPYDFGQIAAANAISDVYAMGGRPITAMAIVGMPTDKLTPATINRILKGGAAKAKSAGVSLMGGHTIKLPEPTYGLAVTGLVDPRKLMTNAAARPGDLLVLTKPLGTGITTTGIKRGLASASLAGRAVRSMKQLNTAGHALAMAGLVRAATDVTGFGLMGHLASMCRASGVAAEVDAAAVPLLSPEVLDLIDQDCIPGGSRANLAAAEAIADWGDTAPRLRTLLADAQTSGGLLLCVPPSKLDAVRAVVREHQPFAATVVGRVVAGGPRIAVRGGRA
jgi:selenide,water dikinase